MSKFTFLFNKVMRLKNKFCLFLMCVLSLSLAACTNAGVQGSSLFSRFQGLTTATAISPTAVQLSWGLDSKYTEYRIYVEGSVTPIKSETFGSTTLSNLQSGRTYNYQVSGFSPGEGEKFVGGMTSVTTFNHFTGLTAGGVTIKSTNEIKLSWIMNSPTTVFKIYTKSQSGTWNLNVPHGILKDANQYTIGSLTPGNDYCFFIRAEYADGTMEPAGTTEAEINALARCQKMTSDMPSLPTVSVNSVTFGDFPWFWTANGDPSYKIEVFDLSNDIRVASRNGNGYFRSNISLAQSKKSFYALVSNSDGNVSRVAVDVMSGGTETQTSIRKLNGSGTRGPVFPPILSGGAGPQNLGHQVVGGDFNCDGLPDIAVAANTFTNVQVGATRNYSNMGAVNVYYTREVTRFDSNGDPYVSYELNTSVLPAASAAAPNPQLITYPVSAHDVQLGTKLAVGNFNNDCRQVGFASLPANGSPEHGNCDQIYSALNTSGSAARIRSTKQCDDLVIGSKGGYFYVIYGGPSAGLVSGSMSNTAGLDEQTCDAVSSTCRASKYSAPPGYSVSSFGRAMTAGDFNNDGFDDIAVSATNTATGVDTVFVYRGDSLGVVPWTSTAIKFADVSPSSGTTTGLISLSSADDFGFSLTAVPNSRLCLNGSPGGYVYRPGLSAARQVMNGHDKSKCADLVIGAPSRPHGQHTGSIYSCRGTNASATDQKISSWSCQEHYPNPINSDRVLKYGHSVLGVANQNGFPVAGNVLGTSRQPNVWGTLFVGAPNSDLGALSTVGSVYGYYVTRNTGNNVALGIQTVLGAGGHNITADNAVPCDRLNDTCLKQRIFPAPAQAGMQFGLTLSSVAERAGAEDPWMPLLAVGAPLRDNIDSQGNPVVDSGAVYLFRGDKSTFMDQFDGGVPITEPKYNPSKLTFCNDGSCTWLSGGISPFGGSIVYSNTLLANARFGWGGAVGFSANSDQSFNGDNQTDVFISAPFNDAPTTANGGVYGFYSSGGAFGSTVVVPSITINSNQSKEGNYKFEEAKNVGDINGDGYDDVMTHINNNQQWVVVIYYGSASGLIQSPAPSYNAVATQPKLFKSISDTGLGEQFFRAGDINGDGYADVFLLSSRNLGSYIYYGSSDGLVTTAEPSVSPVGKNPLRLGIAGSKSVTFSPGNMSFDYLNLPAVESYNNGVQGVTYGRFNNDIYDDIAIRVYSNATIPASIRDGNLDYTGNGRVYIIYGSPSGPKLNTNTGRILLEDSGGNPADVVTTNPCDAINNSLCKVQMLTSPDTSYLFGYSVARRRLYNATLGEFDGLLVSDPKYNSGANTGRVYVYKGDIRGLNPVPIQKLTPRDSGTNFGYTIVEAGDINGDTLKDIVISAYAKPGSSTRAQVLTVFYGKIVQSTSAYGGAPTNSLTDTAYWTPAVNDNADMTGLQPQVVNPISSGVTELFGYGLTALGDFNQDGFADVAVNVPNGDYNVSGMVSQTGYVLILFGSASGLQIDTSKITPSPYPRCYRGPAPVCEPYQVYLPNYTVNDYTHINPNSAGDINGDGLTDLIIGARGRSHPSGQGISTGVIYVLY